MRFLSAFIGFTFLFLAVCFAVTNRQTSIVSFWPFDIQIEAPVYLLTLGALVSGLLLGATGMWISVLPHRLSARRMHRELARMNDTISSLQRSLKPAVSAETAPSPLSSRRWRFWSRS